MAKSEFKFSVGQVVHHKRYDYRGVIVSADDSCEADDDWYDKNQTQPERDQPWYHVLVDRAQHTTYVAESNLEADESGNRIRHPLVPRFFKTFFKGRYWRESLN